jgi:hypothetical protein
VPTTATQFTSATQIDLEYQPLNFNTFITPPQMARSYSEKEEGIQKAIGAWYSHPGRPIADIAREFEVSSWALRRRLHGVPSKIEGGGHNKKLTPDGEQAIIQHIQLLEDFGIARGRNSFKVSPIRFCVRIIPNPPPPLLLWASIGLPTSSNVTLSFTSKNKSRLLLNASVVMIRRLFLISFIDSKVFVQHGASLTTISTI